MSCAFCPNKKKVMPDGKVVLEIDNSDWGPVFWKVLHCLAEKVGNIPNIIKDQSTDFFNVMYHFGKVLPCKICQQHYIDYLREHKIPWSKTLKDGNMLRIQIRNWLFELHNHVKTIQNQEIQVKTIEECIAMYSSCSIQENDVQFIISTIANASKLGIIKHDDAKRWSVFFRRLTIMII